ncbi:unnamed protein product [Owenia fusiformis]|uniref:Voltage-gated hydrogen channel 1 n=1 Tax=Owenia fusiformis TaxID=6347 RepID=A0A8S4PT16_OWEFU|nr:unnamed protein product [Owenia fusiformis]
MYRADGHSDKNTDLESNKSRKRTQSCSNMIDGALNSLRGHMCVICLVVIDLLLTTFLLLIHLRVIQVPPSVTQAPVTSQDNVTVAPPTTRTPPSGQSSVDTAELVLHYIHIAFLSVFLIEIILRLVIKGKDFLKDCWQTFDATVVIATFALYLIFTLVPSINRTVRYSIGYILVLRLFRCTRLGESIEKPIQVETQRMLLSERRKMKRNDDEMSSMKKQIDQQKRALDDLRSRLDESGLPSRQSEVSLKGLGDASSIDSPSRQITTIATQTVENIEEMYQQIEESSSIAILDAIVDQFSSPPVVPNNKDPLVEEIKDKKAPELPSNYEDSFDSGKYSYVNPCFDNEETPNIPTPPVEGNISAHIEQKDTKTEDHVADAAKSTNNEPNEENRPQSSKKDVQNVLTESNNADLTPSASKQEDDAVNGETARESTESIQSQLTSIRDLVDQQTLNEIQKNMGDDTKYFKEGVPTTSL